MGLSSNNLCIGNVLLEINECRSTNEYAKSLWSKSEPIEGTVVLTDKQTDGKGQIGNKWQSEPYQNLTFSIILKPTFLKPEDQFMLSKIVSLACIETFEHFTEQKFIIKWPNDIYIREKKIGGILIENTINSSQISNSVIGMGLNINQEVFENLPRAISLKTIANNEFDKKEILYLLLKKIDVYYFLLRQGKIKGISQKYIQNLLGYKHKMTFLEQGITFKATVNGVNERGQLLLELENGYIRKYNFKEVSWVF